MTDSFKLKKTSDSEKFLVMAAFVGFINVVFESIIFKPTSYGFPNYKSLSPFTETLHIVVLVLLFISALEYVRSKKSNMMYILKLVIVISITFVLNLLYKGAFNTLFWMML